MSLPVQKADEPPPTVGFGTRLVRRIRAAFSRRNVDHDSLNQFVVKLRSDLDLLICDGATDEITTADTRHRIAEELQKITDDRSFERNWNRANHVQRLLVSLYRSNAIDIELQVWMDRARRLDFPGRDHFEARITALADGGDADGHVEDERSALLLALVDSVQQVRSRHYIKMRYAKIAIARVGVMFAISFAFFLATLSLGHWTSVS